MTIKLKPSPSKFGVTEAERRVLWAPTYHAVLDILGTTGLIIPLGDSQDEPSTPTTVTTRGGEQVVFTYSKDRSTFDTPLSFVGPSKIPVVKFDGVDEEADSPDAAYWSRVTAVLTMGAWVNLVDATSSDIFSKYDEAGDTREYRFLLSATDKLQIVLYDESVAANPSIDTEADVALSEDTWVFVVATVDGSADASGLNLYQDGDVVASTDTDDAAFVAMEDLAGTVKLAHQGATPANLFDGSMAGGPLGPFFAQKELTADEIKRLYQLGRVALGV